LKDVDALITAAKRSLRDYVEKWYFVPKGCINILYK
jgi:hypothetical protein